MLRLKTLITGGAGFLGSHLAEASLEAGHETYVYSRHVSSNVREILTGAQFIESSILVRNDIRDACKDVDVVFHVAGITSIGKTIDDPLGTHEVNVDGTLEVLEAARGADVQRFVFISSAAVYGNDAVSPISEDSPYAPISPYGLQKMIGEQYVQLWHSYFKMGTAIIRPFNVYGPRQRGDSQHSGIITRLVEDLRSARPITIFGDGGQIRDFVHVRDVAEAALLTGFAPEANGQIFNIGSGVGISIIETVRMICNSLDVPFAPLYKPARTGDIRESVANITRARNILGWMPKVSFQDGISELAA